MPSAIGFPVREVGNRPLLSVAPYPLGERGAKKKKVLHLKSVLNFRPISFFCLRKLFLVWGGGWVGWGCLGPQTPPPPPGGHQAMAWLAKREMRGGTAGLHSWGSLAKGTKFSGAFGTTLCMARSH